MMQKKAGKLLIVLIVLFTVLLVLPESLHAAGATFRPYTYNSRREALPSKAGYLPHKVFNLTDAGLYGKALLSPQDMFISDSGKIYLLDSGNARILVLDMDMKILDILEEFVFDGQLLPIDKPSGIFVDAHENIYVCDPESNRAFMSDKSGQVKMIYDKPPTELLQEDLEFKPTKIISDNSGMVYITAPGVYQGALLFKPDGSFEGFYGSNKVELSAKLLLDRFWKGVLSLEQAGNIARYIPEEFTSFDIDKRDFIYTVTQTLTIVQKLKKLNPMGNNILEEGLYGELEHMYIDGSLSASRFVDVNVNPSGYINVLDQQNNRIFQYDKEGNLLFIFGGRAQQEGTFLNPVALDSYGNDIYVLDSVKNSITLYRPTDFGDLVHRAIDLYGSGQYLEATQLWEDVLAEDRNYEIAYKGMGKAMMAEKNYRLAEVYFKEANDRLGNSDAYGYLRNSFIRDNFSWFFLGFILLIALMVFAAKRIGLVREKSKLAREEAGTLSMSSFFTAPKEFSEEMKQKNYFPFLLSLLIVLAWFFVAVAQYSLTGFRFNTNIAEEMNLFLLFLKTIPVFILWVLANWGVCTLMDGKGKLVEIFTISAFALIPYLLSSVFFIIASHFITQPEGILFQMLVWAGVLWSITLLFGGLAGIHEYSVGKTLASVFLTLAGVLVIAFLILLVTSLLRQAYSFVYSILHELIYRLR